MAINYAAADKKLFTDYVDFYSDINSAFNNWVEDSSNIHWSDYVRQNSDLEQAWQSLPEPKKSRWDWGQEHYNTSGKSETRTLPKIISVGSDVDRRDLYYTITVSQDRGSMKPSSDNLASYGQFHWNTAGKTEDRILPGIPKIIVDANGNPYVNTNAMGSGENIQKVYQYAIQRFYEAPAGGQAGTYLAARADLAKNIPTFYSDLVESGSLGSLDSYYRKYKLSPWDARTNGAQPLTGSFDPLYYRTKTGTIGAAADAEYNDALAQGDLDVIGRFTRDTYAQYHYTNTGKTQGARGNEAENAKFVSEYAEYLTDADYQLYRDKVLGLSPDFTSLGEWAAAQDPEALQEWYNSLSAVQKEDYNAGVLDIPTLDMIPERLRDRMLMDKGGTTILEGNLSTVLNEKDKEKQKVFSALTIDSLRTALSELRKAKEQETEYNFYNNFPQLSELTSINETMANSLLGDTGIGGILGWIGNPEDIQKSFESQIGQVTGVPSRNTTVYNWQKWFDEQLVTKYKEGATFIDPDNPDITYTIDADFAKDYIDRYLKPRFDNSKSMSEFISYMDVKQNEQNIFQTQSALDSLREIADIRAKAYLDQIRNVSNPALGGAASVFDPEFYLNPTGNFDADDPKLAKYAAQKAKIEADYIRAKTNGATEKVPGTNWTWNQWAYYYGLDINNKQQFAKLHYQVFGAANGYDPAKDLITLKQADEYIKNTILPVIADEKLKIGDITFLNFVTPEEFADALLEGISPEENKEEWDKLLEKLGLSGKDMGVNELKQYIIESFQTEAAKTIREGIKYLNEKKQTPTQEKLGVEYIERPEDAKTISPENETQLYTIFKNAGYQGSEDEFYEKFMTDVDKSEMQLITQGIKGLQTNDQLKGLMSDDPFEAVFSMEQLFPDEDTKKTATNDDDEAPSYFKLFEDDEDTDYKTETGTKILGEFTSFFKGID